MPSRHSGFSLIEVLVALAILSVGLIAASRGAYLAVADHGLLRDRTLARWVAHDELARLRLNASPPPAGSQFELQVVQAGVPLRVRSEVTATPSPLFFRVEVEVRRSEDRADTQPLARAVGFASRVPR